MNRRTIIEFAVVLLVTASVFLWGLFAARSQRGGNFIGGEYLLLLIPVIYYAGRRTVLDWAADIRANGEENERNI